MQEKDETASGIAGNGSERDWNRLLAIVIVVGVSFFVATAVWGATPAPPGSGALELREREGAVIGFAPLLDASVELEVGGVIARARLIQRFRNPSDAWLVAGVRPQFRDEMQLCHRGRI